METDPVYGRWAKNGLIEFKVESMQKKELSTQVEQVWKVPVPQETYHVYHF